MSPRTSTVVAAIIVSLVATVLHAILNSPICPLPLNIPSITNPTSNNLLHDVNKLGEGRLEGPEDLCFDSKGTLYTVTRDGWIKRMFANGSWEDWTFIGSPSLLGLAMARDGSLLVCDADKGLLRVEEGQVTTLASEVVGTKIRFADEAIEASDGSVFFSDASTKFGFSDWYLDLLEARPNGRLLKYDPRTKLTSVVLSNLSFANGVALSYGEEFLVVCETWNFRCLKYWLKGDQAGQIEVFVDNLPGCPDNINLASDDSFWIALLPIPKRLYLIHKSVVLKRVIASFPKLVEILQNIRIGAAAVNVASNGKLIQKILNDHEGRVISFVTSAVEHEGHLYLGTLGSNFIGKLPLE